MIKLMHRIWFVVFTATLSISACAVSGSSEEITGESAFCEIKIGDSESAIPKTFNKTTVYNEAGESYVYRGSVCDGEVLVDVMTADGSINKISIVDADYCSGKICIGDSFKEAKVHLKDAKLYFSGEEGGLFSLETSGGVSYVFSTEEIDIKCYIEMEKCEKEIRSAPLRSIVISQKGVD